MHTNKYLIAALIVTSYSLSTIVTAKDADSEKPNVIIVFTDDQGYRDLGCFGSPDIKTPNIDRMAKEGMRFTDFYAAASVCTPSRAALLTGRYPERTGLLEVLFPGSRNGLNPNEVTIAELLKAKGYATACIGKWHLGHNKEFLPTNHGFDLYYGVPYSNDMWIDPNMKVAKDAVIGDSFARNNLLPDNTRKAKRDKVPLMFNEEIIEFPVDQSTLTARYTDKAITFIEENKDKPFFLYLPHTMPHAPLYAGAKFQGKSESGLYGDCVEEIDRHVGRIIKTLKELAIEQDTFVVYTSDNGPWDLKGSQEAKVKGNTKRRVGGSALPLRGFKSQTWEGGMRVPAVMWWPGRIPAGRVNRELASTIDLLPTIAALAGAELPNDRIIDGKNITPLIEGQEGAKTPHRAFFYLTQAVRSGNWKLREDELFNLADDISESTDLSERYPAVAARLRKLLIDHKEDLRRRRTPRQPVP